MNLEELFSFVKDVLGKMENVETNEIERKMLSYFSENAIFGDDVVIENVYITGNGSGRMVNVKCAVRGDEYRCFKRKLAYVDVISDMEKAEQEFLAIYNKCTKLNLEFYKGFIKYYKSHNSLELFEDFKKYMTVSSCLKFNRCEDTFSKKKIAELEKFYEVVQGLAKKYNVPVAKKYNTPDKNNHEKTVENSQETTVEINLKEMMNNENVGAANTIDLLTAKKYLIREADGPSRVFDKISRDEKMRVAYYEVLSQKIADFNLKLIQKSEIGEIFNKKFSEVVKENEIFDRTVRKVLNDEKLSTLEYVELKYLYVDYSKENSERFNKPYLMKDINEKVVALKKLQEQHPEDGKVIEKTLNKHLAWQEVISNLYGRNPLASKKIEDYAKKELEKQLDNISDYLVSILNPGAEIKIDLDSNLAIVLETAVRVLKDRDGNLEATEQQTIERIENYIRIIKENDKLLKIAEGFRKYDTDSSDIGEYKNVVNAYLEMQDLNLDEDASSVTNHMLRAYVQRQGDCFEELLSKELLESIPEYKLEIPKRYFKGRR